MGLSKIWSWWLQEFWTSSLVTCTWASDRRSYKKNGTMHQQFQLRNLTKSSDFNERTNNYLEKNDIEKNSDVNMTFSQLPYMKSVMIKGQLWWSDTKTIECCFLICLQFKLDFEEIRKGLYFIHIIGNLICWPVFSAMIKRKGAVNNDAQAGMTNHNRLGEIQIK